MNEITDTVSSLRLVNRSAIHTHALKCAKELGRTNFSRVGESFIDNVQAEVERMLHEINNKFQPPVHAVVDFGEENFVTSLLGERAKKVLNAVTARVIQAKVQRHPSVGKTLMS